MKNVFMIRKKTAALPKQGHRDYGFDNVRAILILCVIFAHFQEYSGLLSDRDDYIYRLIYSFHMPALIFLFGYFAKFQPNRIVFCWVASYMVFQPLYKFFESRLFGTEFVLQFTIPYWLLWFSLVCIYYQLLIPLYDTPSIPKQIFTVIIVCLVAILAGYDDTVSSYGEISRFFVNQPWFVLGFYYAKACKKQRKIRSCRFIFLRSILIILAVLASALTLYYVDIPRNRLFGSFPYGMIGYSPCIRMIIMLMALSWISFFVYIIKPIFCRKIPVFTSIGQNTFSVFLLHGFIVKWMAVRHPNRMDSYGELIIVSVITLLLLGNPLVGKCFRFIFSDQWFKAIRRLFSRSKCISG